MINPDINYWAVLVAALSATPVGMIWYNPKVFGSEWMKLSGIKADSPEKMAEMKKTEKPAMMWSLVLALVMAYVLATILSAVDVTSVQYGMKYGAWLWIGLVATSSLTNVLFSNANKKLWAITHVYWLVVLAVMGAILGGWQL
jgi:multidrug transporter EmrE-like cation transporter